MTHALRILNAEADGYSAEARAILETLGRLEEGQLQRASLLQRLAGVQVLITRLGHRVDRELLGAAPDLLAVVSATTGLDHLDLDAARERGVEVLSLRGETDFLETIAATPEHTWALLLALVRRLPAAFEHARGGGWDRDRFRGSELADKRLGLVGLGRVGRRVSRYALAFGMEVAAVDPDAEAWQRPGAEGVEKADSLETLLRRSHVVSLHASLGPDTRGMIGDRELGWARPGTILVNTARGGLVDEAALARALRTGRLGGAAVDVVDHERDAEQRLASPLFDYLRENGEAGNLIVTPHIAGATAESMARTEVFMAHKLRDFLQTRAR
ncbi:MAG: hypothetical protein MI919_25215 [Holophagales bacterium]|nr:hypothetical protein [Holophagales bacterium]